MNRLYDIFLNSEGVSTDSRDIVPGSVFFALKGDNFDGNRYAAAALEKGAAFAVVDDPRVALTDRYLVVNDTLLTLQHLAAHHRRALGIPILAITGTNGKTTTKELTALVLSAKYKVSFTRGNLNNHIGVPLTLLRMNTSTQLGIVEMGAGAEGEIAVLCEIAAPDFGLVTNVGYAHLEGFGSLEGVKRGKGELYAYLAKHGGTAFVAEDVYGLREMAGRYEGLKTVVYSTEEAFGINNPMHGEYNMANIAAAAAIGNYFEISARDIKSAVESYRPDNNRSQKMETDMNTVIMDCYNANPSSMAVAISNFAKENSDRPKTIILGDMMELGGVSSMQHERVLRLLGDSGVKDIMLVGANFEQAVRDFPATGDTMEIKTFDDTHALRDYLAVNPINGRMILLKGSRGIGLEKIADLL